MTLGRRQIICFAFSFLGSSSSTDWTTRIRKARFVRLRLLRTVLSAFQYRRGKTRMSISWSCTSFALLPFSSSRSYVLIWYYSLHRFIPRPQSRIKNQPFVLLLIKMFYQFFKSILFHQIIKKPDWNFHYSKKSYKLNHRFEDKESPNKCHWINRIQDKSTHSALNWI